MNKAEVMAWIKRSKVVPVVRATSPESAVMLSTSLIAGGIDVLEITMTVPGAIETIRELSRLEGVLVGAGTVMDPNTAEACIEAGAQFVVSPSLNRETVAICNQRQIVVAPGALTPTEVVAAHDAGGDVVKVFPCDALGGATYLKSLKAPFPHIALMPTGGITLTTLKDFLAAGAVAVGVGSALVNPKLSQAELTELARKFSEVALNCEIAI